MIIENLPPNTVELEKNEEKKQSKASSPFLSLTWDDWFDLEARLTHFFGEFEYAAEHNDIKELSHWALEFMEIAILISKEAHIWQTAPPAALEEKACSQVKEPEPLMTREQMRACHERIFGRPPISIKALLEAAGLW